MIQPGMTFGSEGPIVQGTWINPNTGDSFTVRDAFFEDNQYIITTTDGRYIRYEQFQNYIQTDAKSVEGIKQSITNKVKDEPLPLEVSNIIDTNNDYSDLIIPEDNIINRPLGNLNDKPTPTIVSTAYQQAPVNMNIAIIEKALKNTEKPNFKVEVDWPTFPEKQIEMLHDIMNIDADEIIEWYLDNIQMIDIVDTIKKSIKDKIINSSALKDSCLESEVKTVSPILEEIRPDKSKKIKTTKSKTKK